MPNHKGSNGRRETSGTRRWGGLPPNILHNVDIIENMLF